MGKCAFYCLPTFLVYYQRIHIIILRDGVPEEHMEYEV